MGKLLLWVIICVSVFHNSDSRKKRIVGGKSVNIYDFPYTVSLQYQTGHICGATIFNDRTIITAAHCLLSSMNISDLRIRAFSTHWEYGGEVHKVIHYTKHPSYDSTIDNNDIAILILETSMKLEEKKIKPIKLPMMNQELKPNDMANVTGWGFTTARRSSGLQMITIPVIGDKTQCSKYLSENDGHILTDKMFCAGYHDGRKDACQGDSGGPLVVNYTLHGVVSWGIGCARPEKPGVYTYVSKFIPFIEKYSK